MKLFTILSLYLISIAVPFKVHSQTSSGIVSSLKTIASLSRENFENTVKTNQYQIISALDGDTEYKIEPAQFRNILLFSDKYISELIYSNDCNFYGLLWNGALKDSTGNVAEIYLISEKDQKRVRITSANFVQEITKKKCQNLSEVIQQFKPQNLANTLEKTTFTRPTTKQQCTQMFDGYKNNLNISFLCSQQTLSNIKNESKKNYLNTLCANLNSSEKFCTNFLSEDIWGEMISGEVSSRPLSLICKSISGNSDDQGNLTKCRQKILENDSTCQGMSTQNSGLPPFQTCKQLGMAINKVNYDYELNDCADLIHNQSIANAVRIKNFFKQEMPTKSISNCAARQFSTFFNLIKEVDEVDKWPLKICYNNRATEERECLQYVPFDDQDDVFSESSVVKTILYKTQGASEKERCSVVSENEFKPLLLKYSTGCFIVQSNNCSIDNCEHKIMFNNKEVKGIEYTGKLLFEYFPSTPTKEGSSIINLLKRTLKIKEKSIANFTDLVSFLSKKKRIIHGMGCIEDLYPELYRRASINSCTPTTFLIDSTQTIDDTFYLSIRTASDHQLLPRLIIWNNLFNSVLNYQNIHPSNLWTLYGLESI